MSTEQSEPMPDDHRAAHERLRGVDKMLAHRVGAVEIDVADQGKRLSKLENERWFLWGIFATAGALVTYVLKGLGLSDK